MTEGNGAQLNYNSGEYGAGSIGRSGVLIQAITKSVAVIVKIDPITEQLERGPDGLCVQVLGIWFYEANGRLVMERRENFYLSSILKERQIPAEHFKGIMETKTLRKRRLRETSWRRGTISFEQEM